MHGVVIEAAGGLEMISWQEIRAARPAAGEVLVRVEAAGVAFGDVLLRRGVSGGRFPAVPGYDLVGIVAEIGAGVTRIRVGERVAAFPGKAAQQESVILPERDLVSVPAGVSPERAAATILNYLTAYQLLTRSAALKRGSKVFIYGLAGGLGSAMRQVAAQLDIEVYGTASRSRLAEAGRGARAFDREDARWVSSVKRDCPNGFDAVFDPIGGASLQRSYGLLSLRGTLVMIGAASAAQGSRSPRLKLLETLARFALLKLRPDSRRARVFLVQGAKRDPDLYHREMATLYNWLIEQRIAPEIHAVLPMHKARSAQEMLETGEVLGKIILITGYKSAHL